MHTIKGFFGWAVMWAGICTTFADELAVTPLTPVEPPALSTNGIGLRLYGAVGVSGTNAIFVWNHASGQLPNQSSNSMKLITNLFLTRLDSSGTPLDSPGKFVQSTGYAYGVPGLLACESGFFLFSVRSFAEFPSDLYFTRLNKKGDPVSSPVLIGHKPYKVASSGKNVLFLYNGGYPTNSSLQYKLIDEQGGLVATGVIPEATASQFSVASDGTNYLAVWQAEVPPLTRGTLISGADATHTNINIDTNIVNIAGLGYGQNGYLLLAPDKLLQLAEDGKVLNRMDYSFSFDYRTAVYGEGDGWTIFTYSGGLKSFQVNPSESGLRIAVDPYPTTPISGFAGFPMESIVAPFGPERYLVAVNDHVAVLTKAGLSEPKQPSSFLEQSGNQLIASDSGYFILWNERSSTGGALVGLRLRKDGTRVDEHPFLFPVSVYPNGIFDGTDYVLAGIQDTTNSISPIIARIAPSGSPTVRIQDVTFTPDLYFSNLISAGHHLFACFSDSIQKVHLFTIDEFGNAGNPVELGAGKIVTDGNSLFLIGRASAPQPSDIYLQRIDPLSSPVEGERTVIGQGVEVFGVSGPRGVLVSWAPSNSNSAGYSAYFTNGVEKFRISTPSILPRTVLNETRALRVTTPGAQRFLFTAINLETGETNSIQTDLGTISRYGGNSSTPTIASAGRDFFGVTDSLGPQSDYIGHFWVTDSELPAFGATKGNGLGIDTMLTLNPARHYRIESSEDLMNWNLEEVVTGVSEHGVTNSGSEKGFVRAVLTPE
ncbi:MAG: hypothetical protein ACXWIU_06740 [Limisphaerales bacterium]